MRKTKLSKRLTAGIATLAMVASASASSLAAITANAGMMTGEGTFEGGAGLPWHVCENGTGEMAFNINDGVYSILIKNPGGASNGGEDRWDCQFRHRNLSITYGNKYRLTYSIYATNSGHAYAKLGDVSNDDAEYWHNNGNKLNMEYKPGMSQSELEDALRSASTVSGNETTSDQNNWDVKYYEGWDKWKADEIPAKKWTTYAWEFYIDKSFMNNIDSHPEGKQTVEWTFHFGGDGQYTNFICFPAGTIVKFDNLALIDMSDDGNVYQAEPEAEKTGLTVNQLGYFPALEKRATILVEKGAAPVSWEVTGPENLSGTASATIYDEGAWEYAQIIDFSKITTPGEYTLTAGGKSVKFTVGNDIYGNLLGDSLNYYYLNRSGIDIEEQYIQNAGQNDSKSALTRKAGHKPDEAYITDEWVFLYTEKTNAEIKSRYSSNGTKDVSGGWYDAGDYGKYVVNGGVSMWTLANAYERNPEKFKEGADFINIPESGNGTPDILDELKWEADFFMKMTRDDGMVYHKMHDYKWTALGVMPYDTSEGDEKVQTTVFPTRIIKPVTYAATLNSAAALAQLARLLEKAGDSSAATYKAAAIKNYKAAKDLYVSNYGSIYAEAKDAAELKDGKYSYFAPLDHNKGGGPYGDTQVTDEFYWAACELYLTTGDAEYYDDLKAYPEAFTVTTNLVGGENKGSPTSFTWGTLASLGTMSLAYNKDKISADEYKKLEQSLQEAGDFYLKVEKESAYGTAYPGHTYDTTVTDIIDDSASERSVTLTGGYEWGSNSMVINNALVMGVAYDVTKDVKYLSGATTAMGYIFGNNVLENSYVTGYGTNTTQYPHHRYWCPQMKAGWPYAPNGCLSGGPNSDMNDPLIQGAGYKIGELAPMKCYLDKNDAWSVNEITINWNAPLVWMAAFAEEEAPKADSNSTEEPTDALYGDVDCNGVVDIVDVLTLNQYLTGIAEYLTPNGEKEAQGKINANVDLDDKIDDADAMNILKSLVKLVTLPVKK